MLTSPMTSQGCFTHIAYVKVFHANSASCFMHDSKTSVLKPNVVEGTLSRHFITLSIHLKKRCVSCHGNRGMIPQPWHNPRRSCHGSHLSIISWHLNLP